MNFMDLINNVTPEVYNKLCQLAETGKWFDGNTMSEEQHEVVQQAVMAYQSKIAKSEEHMSIGADGEIVQQPKSKLKQQFNSEEAIIRVNHDDL